MAHFRLVVSIINFRTPELTIKCVESVLADLGQLDAHVVVIDNASNDGSVARIQRWFESSGSKLPVTLVQSETNSGFSGGHNQCLRNFSAEHYLILNSDAVVQRGFFDALFASVDLYPRSGLFSPTIVDEHGTPQVSFFRAHSPMSEFLRAAGIGSLTRIFKRYEVPIFDPQMEADIDWVSFACVLVRKEVVEKAGLMDEGYFLYFEDSEYCHRARKLGWDFSLVPEAKVLHYEGGSGPVQENSVSKKRQPQYYYEARARYFYQTRGHLSLILANSLWHIGRLFSLIRLIAGKPAHKAVEMEFRDIWTNVANPMAGSKAPK